MSYHPKYLSNIIRGIFGFLLCMTIFYASTYFKIPQCQEIHKHVLQFGFFAPMFFALFYVIATLLFIPGTILTLIAGLAFGSLLGTITVALAATAGASFAFLTSRYLLEDFIQSKIKNHDWFKKLQSSLQNSGFSFVLFVRLVPLFPFNGLNYACGLLPLTFRDYFFGTLIGMLPGTFAYVYLGATGCRVVDSILENNFKFSDFPADLKISLMISIISLIFLSSLPLIIRKLRLKK